MVLGSRAKFQLRACRCKTPLRTQVSSYPEESRCERIPARIAAGHCRHDRPMGYPDELVVQAKVTIQRIDPPIWRQVLVPLALNLAGLHEVIQAAFGWTDSPPPQFIIGRVV